MKPIATFTIALALSTSTLALAQSGNMKGMDKDSHQGMQMDMNKDMKMGMDKDAPEGMSKGPKEQSAAKRGQKHQATATVKAVDSGKGTVTLAHDPIKSLNWPAMTMGFGVKDKMLFDKMTVGKRVTVELVQDGSQYVVTDVK